MKKKNKLKNMSCIAAATITLLTGCGAALPNSSDTSNQIPVEQTEELKPGEEGFTFACTLPEDILPEKFGTDNGKKIKEIMLKLDEGKGESPATEYYGITTDQEAFAKIPDPKQWNINPNMPKILYEIPLNLFASSNNYRIIENKELAALNPGKLKYYVQAAIRAACANNNIDYKIPESNNLKLYYYSPEADLSSFELSKESIQQWEVITQGAFVTDESLCYLGSDGHLRVRGLQISRTIELGEEHMDYNYMEMVMIPTTEEMKQKPCEWEFGDILVIGSPIILQPSLITEEELQTLIKKHKAEFGIPQLPEWANTYGGSQK